MSNSYRLYNVFYYFKGKCEMEIESAWYYGTALHFFFLFNKRIDNSLTKTMVSVEKLCVTKATIDIIQAIYYCIYLCVCACVRACVRACVCACERERERK